MPGLDDPQHLELVTRFLDTAQHMREVFRQVAAAAGLGVAEANALVELVPGSPAPQRALAERMGTDPSNLSDVIDRLEARALVARRAGAADRRVKVLELTAAGVRLRSTIRGELERRDVLAAFPAADRRALLRMLRAVDGAVRPGG